MLWLRKRTKSLNVCIFSSEEIQDGDNIQERDPLVQPSTSQLKASNHEQEMLFKEGKQNRQILVHAALTCHHILWGRISICSHNTGRDMSLISLRTILGKSKIRELRIVFL